VSSSYTVLYCTPRVHPGHHRYDPGMPLLVTHGTPTSKSSVTVLLIVVKKPVQGDRERLHLPVQNQREKQKGKIQGEKTRGQLLIKLVLAFLL